jgi:hypothetical protein
MQIQRSCLNTLAMTFFLITCVLGISGCGSDKVVAVSGRVTRNDKPVPGVVISFVPQATSESGPSTGTTDDDGKYTLTIAKTGWSGAVVGTHKVWVSLPRDPPPFDDSKKEEKKHQPPKKTTGPKPSDADIAAILKKYGQMDKSPLTVEVKGGQPVDLKLD